MAVIEGRTWMEVLSPAECVRRLSASAVGRIALEVDGHPEIFPVNFAMDGDAVVFRTDVGTKLEAVERPQTVAFEVDGFDEESRGGWSVLVVAHPQRVRDTEVIARLDQLGLEPWLPGEKHHWVRLDPLKVTGRRIHQTKPD